MDRIGRRRFIAATTVLLGAQLARAQAPSQKRVLGHLSHHSLPTPEAIKASPLLVKLRSLGWREGENLVVERAFAGGKPERLPELAEDLVRKRVDVIYAFAEAAAIAAARATKSVPIVFWGTPFPVELGLVQSLARPGGNVTGVALHSANNWELFGKQLQLMKEIAPGITRVATLTNPALVRTAAGEQFKSGEDAQATVRAAAKSLALELRSFPVNKREEFDAAFAAILAFKPQGFFVSATPLNVIERARIIEFANRNHLVSSVFDRTWVQMGGLFSYGADTVAGIQQAAAYIDRIFRGAKPADLPVIRNDRYELIVNAKTAREIGITLPQSILGRADEVIG
jgi:putative ABC transport system substrate-binding protein